MNGLTIINNSEAWARNSEDRRRPGNDRRQTPNDRRYQEDTGYVLYPVHKASPKDFAMVTEEAVLPPPAKGQLVNEKA